MIEDDLRILKSTANWQKLRLMMVDYDGTLVPIRPKPEQAVPTAELLANLSLMSRLRRLKFAVISGRSLEDLRSMIPLPGICMAGSHGAEILDDKADKPIVLARESLRSTFQRLAHNIQKEVGDLQGIWIERKPFTVAMHYRGADAGFTAVARKRFRETVSGCPESELLKISENKFVMEITPRDVSKALAVSFLLESCRLTPEESIYIGDDRTDEDAFDYLHPRGITVKVAQRPCITAARYRLNGYTRVIALLKHLLQQANSNDWI